MNLSADVAAAAASVVSSELVLDEQPVGEVHQVTGLESVAESVAAIAAHEQPHPASPRHS